MAEASFPAYLFAFFKQKQHISAILRQEREKGRNKKDDQTSSCVFGRKMHISPILSNFLPRR